MAGCAVAWQAHFRGLDTLLIDRQDRDSSSRVAAGLVTPITGGRAAASWKWDDYYSLADVFYRRIERMTGSFFWNVAPAIKVFETVAEFDLYHARWMNSEVMSSAFQPRIRPVSGASCLKGLHTPFEACEMLPSARLDTENYLRSTHEYFERQDAIRFMNLDCEAELDCRSESIAVRSLGLQATSAILCQGVAARENLFFKNLPLHPARGDVLQIESKSLRIDQVVHGQGWIVPTGGNRFLVGATYNRSELSSDCSDLNLHALHARDELIQRWEALVQGSFAAMDHRVVGQRAAVRPASYDRHPLIGQHETFDRLYCMNGLGSKGSLMAPGLASTVLDAIHGAQIPSCLDWKRRR